MLPRKYITEISLQNRMISCIDQCTFGGAPQNAYDGLNVTAVKDSSLGLDLYVSTHKPKSSEQPPNAVFIYSHANSEDLQLCETWMNDLASILNSIFVCYDYPGYGETEGKPSEAACRTAAETVYQYVVSQYPNHRIFIWGRSVGTVPTLSLGSRFGEAISGIIIESGMASAGDVACRRGCLAL